MNELIKLVEGEIVADSRMIAEHFGKEHAHVLRDIKDELEKLGEIGASIFGLSSYTSEQNKTLPCYTMDEEGLMQIAARYDAVARRKLILMIKELKQKNQHRLPQTYSEALIELAGKVAEVERLAIENTELKPKAEFYDDVVDSKDAIDMGSVAKVLNVGIGRNKLFEILREQNVLMSNNIPYQNFVDRGWFRLVESKYQKPNGDTCINIKTVVFQKGVDGIRKLLKGLGE